ncbi:LacI family DNA-binding transcriptional regulator [Actibacterium sp. 188UL27-1]|uniref:LacI family DNA-binding transcriptional regulator n=1 Tax=Actibacterium sp. 188UL27-1 TaxID=2786961 RepID=UPI0019563B7C|nr:substrate-binding domain-containing protein [Actibacterium sp. 188UL27-1]MBM7067810.1 substrate-binding domain-containing protein [Actibacterium sp. 188UL27-1]
MNLKELSEFLGLSQTTVSRALNGYPEVNEQTRERVLAAAQANDYRPNSRAKGLATGRAMAIGHVIPTWSQHEIVNPIFSDFIAGAGEAYAKAGYDMLLSVVSDEDEARAYRELQARGAVDGVILHAPRDDDSRINMLQKLKLPFVVHGRVTAPDDSYCWVDVNNQEAFETAGRHLLDFGHRRIALINGQETMGFARRRRQGLETAMADYGVTPDPDLMWQGEMTEHLGYSAAKHMLALPEPPTAMLVASLIVAYGARRALEEAGLVLGRDVSIVTHDDVMAYMRNEGDPPVFTATRSSVREAGRLAAQMLLSLIADPNRQTQQTLLKAELIQGQSTGPVPPSVVQPARKSHS